MHKPPCSPDADSADAIAADPTIADRIPIDRLDEEICRLACYMNAVNYRLLLLVRHFDDRFGWAKWGFSSCADWLAWRCGIGLSAAREKVRVAHALRDLPVTSKAFEEGRVSYSKVRALTRAADVASEKELLAHALEANAAQVEERCRQIRNAHRDSAEEARRAWQRRSLSIFRNPSRGTLTISVELPLEAGEMVARAIDRAVQAGEVASGPEFGGDGWHAQQADALVAVARGYLCSAEVDDAAEHRAAGNDIDDTNVMNEEDGKTFVQGEDASISENGDGGADAAPAADMQSTSPNPRAARTVADHYQVVVHVDESALRGGAGRSELPVETVRRLACDCTVSVVTENAAGDPLNVGRKHRIVPPRLRRALWSRDRGCTFPGCRNTRFVRAHHLRHWTFGGETSLENTALMCTHHHRLVHDDGLRVRRLGNGELEFRRRDGRVIPRCGYKARDAAPDPVFLEGSGYTSAEGWLAALVGGKRPADHVREERGVYSVG